MMFIQLQIIAILFALTIIILVDLINIFVLILALLILINLLSKRKNVLMIVRKKVVIYMNIIINAITLAQELQKHMNLKRNV